jgi:Plasmid pRiA4b ORF-3-like protein
VYGYAELLKALKDPSHPEHEDILEWIGEDYDPSFFDLEAVNQQLAPRRGGLQPGNQLGGV